MSTAPRVSIVICSIDAAQVRARVRELSPALRQHADRDHRHSRRALARRRRTTEASRAPGELQIIVSHDDIEILNADFAARVERHLERFDLIGIAGTTRLDRRPLGGRRRSVCLHADHLAVSGRDRLRDGAHRRGAAGRGGHPGARRRVHGNAPRGGDGVRRSTPTPSIGFHHYDLDFSLRAFQARLHARGVPRSGAHPRVDRPLRPRVGGIQAPLRGEASRAPARRRGSRGRARAPRFSAATRDEVATRCAPGELAHIAAEIGRANAGLDR